MRDRQLPWDRDRWSTSTLPNGQMLLIPFVSNPVTMPWSNRPAHQIAAEFRGPTREE